MDNACVELKFLDGSMIAIDTIAVENEVVKYLISGVELFPCEEQRMQKRFAKVVAYRFPAQQKVLTQFDECGASVETVVLLSKGEVDSKKIRVELSLEDMDMSEF